MEYRFDRQILVAASEMQNREALVLVLKALAKAVREAYLCGAVPIVPSAGAYSRLEVAIKEAKFTSPDLTTLMDELFAAIEYSQEAPALSEATIALGTIIERLPGLQLSA